MFLQVVLILTVFSGQVAYESRLLILASFSTDQQQKTSVPQAGVNQQEEAKNNASKNPGTSHIRDLFLSFDKGM